MKKLTKFNSKFYAKKSYIEFYLKEILENFLEDIYDVVIYFEVIKNRKIKIYTNRPGIIIGKGGIDINNLKTEIYEKTKIKNVELIEMKYPNLIIKSLKFGY